MSFRWMRYFQGQQVMLFPEMTAAIICQRFGWTWEEYQAQPWHFLQAILEMIQAESRESAKNKSRP